MHEKVTKALLATSWFLAPIRPALLTALGLVFLDLVLGLLAARKRKEALTSWGLRRTVAKLLAYELAIVLAFLVERNLGGGLPFSHIVGGFVGITELKSCYENIQVLTSTDLGGLVTKIQQAQNPFGYLPGGMGGLGGLLNRLPGTGRVTPPPGGIVQDPPPPQPPAGGPPGPKTP